MGRICIRRWFRGQQHARGGPRERAGRPDGVLELRQMGAEADLGGPNRARVRGAGRGGSTLWDRLADDVAGTIMLPRAAQNESATS